MGKRNFGLGHRDMKRAGRNAIDKAYESYSSRQAISERWSRFIDHIREGSGIKKMEDIDREHIEDFARKLKEEGKSASTQQNYVSAVNRVMEEARQDREVRLDPSEICDRRTTVATIDRSITNEEHEIAVEQVDERVAALLDLQREFGLRFEESSKLNAKSTLEEAKNTDKVTIEYGTKGGQTREIEIRNDRQIEVLERAAEIQNGERSMIPEEISYREFRSYAYFEIDKTEVNFHAERHTYAQERYMEIVGHEAPVKCLDREESWIPYLARELGIEEHKARHIDSQARMQISKELGHHREDIVAAYLGGKG